MNLRNALVKVVDAVLRDAGGNAGRMMLDAHRFVSAEKDASMLALLESIRLSYIADKNRGDE